MDKEEALEQLYSLIDDRKSFISEDKESSKLFEKDIEVIKYLFVEDLIKQNKKYKGVIDKAIKFLEEWGKEPDADMYMLMNEYKEFNELLDILKEVSE